MSHRPSCRPPHRLPRSLACRLAGLSVLLVAACGAPAPPPAARAPATAASRTAIVDPAALYCAGVGGTVIHAQAGGRRADLCRMPDGRTVRAADLINADNDL